MRLRLALAFALLALCACGSEPDVTVVFVSVDVRPTVRTVASLRVEVANEGATRSQDFDLSGDASFPKTFTVTPGARTGDLVVLVEARDVDDRIIGKGRSQVAIVPNGRADVAVLLDPEDFVVNETVARTQWISFRTELAGRQVAVGPGDRFLVAFENDCPLARCDILSRLFGPDARPHVNATTGTDGDFVINQTSEYTETAALAGGGPGFLAAWLVQPDMMTFQRDVKAVVLSADGQHLSSDISVSSSLEDEASPSTVPLADGAWAVVWQRDRPMSLDSEIRARVLGSDGTPIGPDFPVSSDAANDQSLPFAAPLAGGGFVVVWIHTVGGQRNVRARVFDGSGQAVTVFDIDVTQLDTGSVTGARVAGAPDGDFVVTWQRSTSFDEPQPLRLRRFAPSGVARGPAVTVAEDSRDFSSIPVVAVRPSDGAVGVAWQDSDELGDGQGRGIRFQLLWPSGLPVGDSTIANTTLAGNQDAPTVVPFGQDAFLLAWTDGSMAPPDTDGNSVRARVLYPPLERHDGSVGAFCGGADDDACGTGLSCAMTLDGKRLCHPTCSLPDSTPCPGGGVCVDQVCRY